MTSGGFLADIEKRQRILQEAMPRIRADISEEIRRAERRLFGDTLDRAILADGEGTDLKTIGVKVPVELRERLIAQANLRGLGSYSRAVLVALRFGVAVMELLPLPQRRKARLVPQVEPEPEVVQHEQSDVATSSEGEAPSDPGPD